MKIPNRAIPFTGNWEQTVKDVREFRPWNRPGVKSSAELNNINDNAK